MAGADGEDGSHPVVIPSRGERMHSRMEGAGDDRGDCFPGPVRQVWILSVSLQWFPFQMTHTTGCEREGRGPPGGGGPGAGGRGVDADDRLLIE
jgi:hypothetical protein